MNVQFQATQQQEERIQQLAQKVDNMKQGLASYMDEKDKEKMDQLT